MNRDLALAGDPIALEILSNALISITDECFVALMKSAYSTNIKERHDHSTAIVDARGRLIVQAKMSLPIHIATMMGTVQAVLRTRRSDIREGDLYAANDPFVAGGSHLPDVNVTMPVFRDGKLIAFVCNIAHHADIGGMSAGSMAGGMTEIYQEGLRIPVVRLIRDGVLQEDLLDLLLLNARVPNERRGDWFAQFAAAKLGVRRFHETVDRYGAQHILAAFDEIIAKTESRLRSAVATIPDGTYRFRDVMDDDGVAARDIPIALEIRKSGDGIVFDFKGSSSQVPGNINLTMNGTVAAVAFALKALLDPDIPNNEGVLRVIDVRAEEGLIVNAAFPAATAARLHSCQRVADIVFGALAQALPAKVVAAGNGSNTTAVFSGVDPRSGEPYVYLETLGGGAGGRHSRDGKDGVQVNLTNTSNLPVEAIEMEYPLMVDAYELVPDSGGPGRYRGGLALRRTIRPVNHTCVFNGAGERFTNPPWGLFGGGSGSTGINQIKRADGSIERLPNKPSGVTVSPSETVIVQTPGAGGYGAASERPADARQDDLLSGKFSADFMRKHYS
jgi:N-methylhydantoinase B